LESIKEYPSNKFDIRFLKSNGNHDFITFQNIDPKTDKVVKGDKTITYLRASVDIRRERVITKKDELERYRIIQLNEDGSDFIEIGQYVEVNNIFIQHRKDKNGRDKKIYVNEKNEELPDQNKFAEINGKIFKKFNYLNTFITNIDSKENGHSSHLTYSIDEKSIEELCSLINKNQIKSDDDLLKKKISFISDILSNLYNSDSYIIFDQRIKNNDLLKNKRNNVLNGIKDSNPELKDYVDSILDPKLDVAEEFNKVLNNFKLELKSSFLKSLEVIASRIPAQTLQSFMSMEVVGFTQMETNVAYVSHIQTFLQGSDYDIDKSYMISYFFDDNGRFIKWSNLMDLSSIESLNESTKLPVPNGVRVFKDSEISKFTSNSDLTTINKKLNRSDLSPANREL